MYLINEIKHNGHIQFAMEIIYIEVKKKLSHKDIGWFEGLGV